MPAEALPHVATSEHLTAALRQCGALERGRVSQVERVNARMTVLSQIVRLRLSFENAPAGAPTRLVLKTAHPERTGAEWMAGRQEVAFYKQVAVGMPVGHVPRCFEATWDAQSNGWHLLLEDLTDTHDTASVWPLPPRDAQCTAIVQALARFHAYWWDEPRLGISVGTWLDAPGLEATLQKGAERYTRFAESLGDRLPRDRRLLYERFIDQAPRLMSRYHARRHATIVHGDAHAWNSLLPRDGGADVRLFDWDLWDVGIATDDLAYLMALHWYPDRRRHLERPLLDAYHDALIASGVRDYDRAALDADYRQSVLSTIMLPVWQATNNIPPVIWWNNFERIMLAADDLGCRGLLA
jgi:hypothetical protein